MKFHPFLSTAVLAAGLLFLPALPSVAEEAPIKKEKLQIVFCFGQSNMVGVADVKTAWYLSEKGFHYHGSAKFFLLNGDALARTLAKLMAK
jgi:hypothetical protein